MIINNFSFVSEFKESNHDNESLGRTGKWKFNWIILNSNITFFFFLRFRHLLSLSFNHFHSFIKLYSKIFCSLFSYIFLFYSFKNRNQKRILKKISNLKIKIGLSNFIILTSPGSTFQIFYLIILKYIKSEARNYTIFEPRIRNQV